MNNFFETFNSLSKKEVKQFQKYMHLDFKENSIPLKIFDYYSSFHQKKKPPPKKEIVFEKIFGYQVKSKKALFKLNNGLSDLFISIKDFLILQNFKQRKIEKELVWLEILENKKLSRLRGLTEKRLSRTFEELEVKNIWHPLYELRFQHFQFFRNSFQKINPYIEHLKNGLENLEEFYVSMKMKFASEVINRKSLLPRQEYLPHLNSILKYHKRTQPEELSKNSKLYFTLYNFLSSKTMSDYESLKEFLKNNKKVIHQDEKLTTLIYMLNFLANKIKTGNTNLMDEAFNLYKLGLEANILIYNNRLDEVPFNNIVNTACYFEKYDWAKTFINEHKIFLEENIREEVSSVAMLIILFKEKKFTDVRESFYKLRCTNVLFKISSQIHYLASLYELNSLGTTYSPVDSFIRFLNLNKMVGKRSKEAALNFAKILKKLMRKKLSPNQIQKEINDRELVFFRTWLQSKADLYQQI